MYCGVYQAVDPNEQRATELIYVLCESEEVQFTVICDALITDGQQKIVDDFLRRNYFTHSLFTNDANVFWVREVFLLKSNIKLYHCLVAQILGFYSCQYLLSWFPNDAWFPDTEIYHFYASLAPASLS